MLIALGLLLTLTTADARAQEAEEDSLRRAFAGINLAGALPTGAFKEYVETGLGLGGYFLYSFDQRGAFGLRFDLSWVQYGSETERRTLIPRILVDVTTRNYIYSVLAGPQLTLRSGSVSPYLNAGLGFSYFETRSSVSGTSLLDEDFASTRHFWDTTFAWAGGGGICVAVLRDISFEFAARYVWNGQVSYLREGSITEELDGSISFTPIQSETNFVLLQLGISLAVL